MKILLLATAFAPGIGGTDRFAVSLARGLRLAGCRVHVLTTLGAREQGSINDVKVTRTPSILNRKFLKLLPLIAAAIVTCWRERPDRVVAMVWTHEGIAAAMLRALFGIEYVVVAHGSEILQYRDRPLYGPAMRLVLGRASMLVANSRFTRTRLVESGVDPSLVVVINPPVEAIDAEPDVRAIEERFGLGGRVVMFTAARLVPRKGHADVIRMLARLKDRYPNLVYVMTGTGEYRRELQALASCLGVAHRIVFAGRVSDQDLRCLYRRTDVYVAPSIEIDGDVEGFGIALAEAAAHGVPVIAGRSGGVDDVVEDGETGLLVAPGDLEDLTQAVVSLLDDDARRRSLGARARARVLHALRVDLQGARLHGYLSAHAVNHGNEALP